MKSQIVLVAFIFLPFINAGWDAIHGERNHLRSWFFRAGGIIIMAVAISFIVENPWEHLNKWYSNNLIWLYIFIGAATEWLIFDYAYNWLTGRKMKYIGEEKWHKDDFTYKMYRKAGFTIMLCAKIFVFLTALSLLFQLDGL